MHALRSFWLGLASLVALVLVLAPGAAVHAANEDVLRQACNGNTDVDSGPCLDDRTQSVTGNSFFGPNGILTKAAQIIAYISGVAGVFLIIIGGLKYILASGEAAGFNSAKNTVLYAVVGMVVAAASQAIVTFVLNRI